MEEFSRIQNQFTSKKEVKDHGMGQERQMETLLDTLGELRKDNLSVLAMPPCPCYFSIFSQVTFRFATDILMNFLVP